MISSHIVFLFDTLRKLEINSFASWVVCLRYSGFRGSKLYTSFFFFEDEYVARCNAFGSFFRFCPLFQTHGRDVDGFITLQPFVATKSESISNTAAIWQHRSRVCTRHVHLPFIITPLALLIVIITCRGFSFFIE